ncbi:MAG: hypothetical protein ACI39H_09105 [Lachnospiraceae bacterium]
MFQDNVQKRLALFIFGEGQPVQVSDKMFHLTEQGQGEADLTIRISKPCILFRDLENKKLQYFENQKCADYVIFENNEDRWRIHIFELKRSIGVAEWKKTKSQFSGALQNALALAGVLGIQVELKNLILYTVYRNDKLKDAANPAVARFHMHEKDNNSQRTDCQDWNDGRITLDFVEDINAEHHKIKLDIEHGIGECELVALEAG